MGQSLNRRLGERGEGDTLWHCSIDTPGQVGVRSRSCKVIVT